VPRSGRWQPQLGSAAVRTERGPSSPLTKLLAVKTERGPPPPTWGRTVCGRRSGAMPTCGEANPASRAGRVVGVWRDKRADATHTTSVAAMAGSRDAGMRLPRLRPEAGRSLRGAWLLWPASAVPSRRGRGHDRMSKDKPPATPWESRERKSREERRG
jgi:hypothetical protein